MKKQTELFEELQSVFAGRGTRILDSLLPVFVFLLLNAFVDMDFALLASIVAAVLLASFRMLRRESLIYALGGLGGVLLAAGLVLITDSAAGFFLPGLISGGVTIILCLGSVLLGKPLVAWTSFLTRRWPLEWYWHPQVRPAYTEVTLAWAVFFGLRLALQYILLQQASAALLGITQILTGWPFTIALLIASYLYGLWRLQNLSGPSVEEFKAGMEPPWESQRRGF
ncbi:MAG: DUF3159 domain-containing protein [Anaerolineales bacterium]|nr:DUF3159 domain-containing protein [Anaerolineales bacterium]